MRRVPSLAVIALAVVACKKPEAPPRAAMAPAQGPAQAQPAPAGDNVLRGKILEKIDVSQYSYLKLDTKRGQVWAAVQKTDKKVGEDVGVGNSFPMQGFESKELNRKFDVVYFGSLAGPGGEVAPMAPAMGGGAMGGGAMGGGMPPAMGEGAPNPAQLAAQHQAVVTGPNDVKVEKIAKAGGADGRTVEEIWSQREKLKGKAVAVRGQVVKATAVMGKNFLHLRDGSGSPDRKTNDLTVTTSDAVGVGDVVTAKGVITTDKDFGAGYAYPVIIEDAKVNK
jgi:hypothetical protein